MPLLLASIGANYAVARLIAANEGRRIQGWLLAGGIVGNVAALMYFKYLATLLGLASASASQRPCCRSASAFLPSPRSASRSIAGRGWSREPRALNYALFVTFFPHLIAGPILHNREIMPQFATSATYRVRPPISRRGWRSS